ncbi:hypothetical protein [Amycolatopsis sp. H20-H5]|uniref:hypothetical protein n=1 Tax=Amycolatopsis sp. H20-H5 TaxID=3046309 RepID=UPI002DB97F50|nr:hypothetical protein [Amycolatopsis sp. H20-H5]MEC3975726.1 hypothetical protein [Amycolatopsis sp. H20-H5]
MLRTAAQRRPTGVSPRAATAADLLDRTGIIAASLPQRRRSPEGLGSFGRFDPEATDIFPVFTTPIPDLDLRPKSVVIHRRVKSWFAGSVALALLALGWISGSMFGAAQTEDASRLDARQAVAAQPAPVPVPQPAPAQPAAAPVTIYVPVPAPKPSHTTATPKLQQAPEQQRTTKPTADPRVDLPAPTTHPQTPAEQAAQQMQDLVGPFFAAADNMMPGNR